MYDSREVKSDLGNCDKDGMFPFSVPKARGFTQLTLPITSGESDPYKVERVPGILRLGRFALDEDDRTRAPSSRGSRGKPGIGELALDRAVSPCLLASAQH